MRGTETLPLLLDGDQAVGARYGVQTLPTPFFVEQATQEAGDDLDYVQAFIEERCRTGDPHAFVPAARLHRAYREWCEEEGVTSKGRRTFTMAMKAKGFDYTRQYLGERRPRGFRGIKMRYLG